MAEVIRDVLIKVRVEQADARAFEAAAKSAGQVGTAAAAAGEKASAATKKQTAEAKTLDDELKKVRRAITETAEAYAKTGRTGGAALNALVRQEKELTAAIERRQAIEERARGPKTPAGGGGGGVNAAREALGRGLGFLGLASIPVMIIGFAPGVAKELATTLRGLEADFFGTPEERRTGGLFSGPANELGEAVVRFLARSAQSDSALGRFFGTAGTEALLKFSQPGLGEGNFGVATDFVTRGITTAIGLEQAAAKEKQRHGLVEKEIQARQQEIAFLEQIHQRQRTALEVEMRLAEERIRTAQQLVDAEQKRLDAAREQFGLLNADEKRDFRRIAEKVAGGGVGSLSADELKFARQNPAIAALMAEEARKAADAAGFGEIARLLGADKRLAEAKQKLAIELEQKVKIEAEIKGLTATEDKLKEDLQRFLEEHAAKIQQRWRAEIVRIAREMIANAFAGD